METLVIKVQEEMQKMSLSELIKYISQFKQEVSKEETERSRKNTIMKIGGYIEKIRKWTRASAGEWPYCSEHKTIIIGYSL